MLRTKRLSTLVARRVNISAAFIGTVILLLLPSAAIAQRSQAAQRDAQAYARAKGEYDKAIATSRYQDAVRHGRQMLALAEQIWPNDKHIVGNQCQWLAVACAQAGLYDEAEKNYDRALALREAAHGPEHPLVAETLGNMSNLYRRQGRYAEGETAARRSLTIREQHFGPDHKLVGESANHLGSLYFEQGRYAEADALLRRALELRQQALGPSDPDVANSLANLAVLYRQAGQLAEAIDYDQRALAIRRANFGRRHATTAFSLNNLAMGYASVGRFTEAVRLYEDALAVRQELLGAEHPETLVTMNNLAAAYGSQGRAEDSLAMHLRVLEAKRKVFGDEHPSVTISLGNLASGYTTLGQYDKSLELRRQSLERFAAQVGTEHPSYALGLTNLGKQYQLMERYDDAIAELQRAAAILEKAYGPNHPDVASALANLAHVYMSVQRFDEAEPLWDRVIEIRDAAGVAPGERYTGYFWRSQLKRLTGDRRGSEADLEQAMQLAEQQRTEVSGSAQVRAEAFAAYRMAYEFMVSLKADAGDVAGAFQAAERGRARSLADQMAAAHVDLLAGLPAEEAQRLNQRERRAQLRVAQLEKMLQVLLAQGQLSDEQQAVQDKLTEQLAEARRELVDAYTAIRNASPAYRRALGESLALPALDEIQQTLLGEDRLLLEYALGTFESFVIIVPPSGRKASIHKLEIDRSQAERLGLEAGSLTSQALSTILINDEGTGLLQRLSDPDEALRTTDVLAALWEVLIPSDLREEITSDRFSRLIVVPDGVLNLLPLDALVVESGDRPRYLLDVGPPIIYGPSAALLYNLERSHVEVQSDRKPVLTVGDPSYGNPATADGDVIGDGSRYALFGGILAPLPFSGRESRWVSEVFQKQNIDAGQLTGRDATEARVRFNVAGRKIVHLACHGLADEQMGNFFGSLALAPGGSGQGSPADDGFLTLPEIYDLDMRGCNLAILSACNTNYGPQLQGEGVFALSRGFLVAGARRVVASNWLVDDEAAASLVSVFCAGIAEAEGTDQDADYAASLHDAKRWVRRQAKWQSPYYWATFVQLGPG